MGMQKSQGVNFSIGQDRVEIFGVTGVDLGNGSWVFKGIRVDANPIMPDILAVLAQDEQNGVDDQVREILVGPGQAVHMFLDGIITRDQLLHSDESLERIEIEGVITWKGRPLNVRILQELDTIASADEDSEIL